MRKIWLLVIVFVFPLLSSAQDFGSMRLQGAGNYGCSPDGFISTIGTENPGQGSREVLYPMSDQEIKDLRRQLKRQNRKTTRRMRNARGKQAKRLKKKRSQNSKLLRSMKQCEAGKLFTRACTVLEGDFSPQAQQLKTTIIQGDLCQFGTNTPFVRLDILDASKTATKVCTAIAVRNDTFITAAHCLYDAGGTFQFNGINVVTSLGTVYSGDYAPVEGYTWKFGADNEQFDAAVVWTQEVPGLATAQILSAGESLVDGERVIIGGFGDTQTQVTNRLQGGFMYIDSFDPTKITTRWDGLAGTSNTCTGDSGGPILVKRGSTWYVAGMLSAGLSPTCSPGDTVTYANLLGAQMRTQLAEMVYFDQDGRTDF